MEKKKETKLVYETQASLYAKAVEVMKADELIVQHAFKKENYLNAAAMFEEVGDYNDAPQLAEECRKKAEQAGEDAVQKDYELAVYQKKRAKSLAQHEKAVRYLEKVRGYKDADTLLADSEAAILRLRKKKAVKKYIRFAVAALLAGILFYSWHSGKLESVFKSFAGLEPRSETVSEGNGQAQSGADLPLEQQMEELAQTAAGDLVWFGNYDWYVLENDGSRVMLLMAHAQNDDALKYMPYHSQDEAVTWEGCSLRSWLNGSFLENFTQEELNCIVEVQNENPDNPVYQTEGGNSTADRVFLLSADDVQKYTDIIRKIRVDLWLRGPGNAGNTAAFTTSRGGAMTYGYPVNGRYFCACPVIVLQTDRVEELRTEEADMAQTDGGKV